ncbi:MAG: ORF6N domain-containing protein [Candidatus Paceibacterota bacterium]|jgi:hypothetical protein
MISSKQSEIIPLEVIGQRILIIRGVKVMLDADLAELYQVSTKRLNEQVKRNSSRFPEDFMFQLTELERNEVVANCDHLTKLKFSYQLPYAFTEHGVVMLSAVLNSGRAVEVSIFIARAFIKIREMLAINKEFAHKVEELEREQYKQGGYIVEIQDILRLLIEEPVKPKDPIGFKIV